MIRKSNKTNSSGALETVAGIFESVQGGSYVINAHGDSSFFSVATKYTSTDEFSVPSGQAVDPPLFVSTTAFKSTHTDAKFNGMSAETVNFKNISASAGGVTDLKGAVKLSGLPNAVTGKFLIYDATLDNGNGGVRWSDASAGTNDPSSNTYGILNMTDAVVGTQTDTQVLAWSNSASKWKPMDSLLKMTVTTEFNSSGTSRVAHLDATSVTSSGLQEALQFRATDTNGKLDVKSNSIEFLDSSSQTLLKLVVGSTGDLRLDTLTSNMSTISNIKCPTSDFEVANKRYVDSLLSNNFDITGKGATPAPVNGQVIMYNTASATWIPATVLTTDTKLELGYVTGTTLKLQLSNSQVIDIDCTKFTANKFVRSGEIVNGNLRLMMNDGRPMSDISLNGFDGKHISKGSIITIGSNKLLRLVWNTGSYYDIDMNGFISPTPTLQSLTDTNISGQVTGDVLSWSGTQWVAQSGSSGRTLTTVGTNGVVIENGIFDQTSDKTMTVTMSQDLRSTASPTFVEVSTTSCASKKKNIHPLDCGVLDKMDKIDACSFEWRESIGLEGKRIGLIAQDIEDEFPEAICDIEGVKRVNNNALIGVLWASVRELRAEVRKLKRTYI